MRRPPSCCVRPCSSPPTFIAASRVLASARVKACAATPPTGGGLSDAEAARTASTGVHGGGGGGRAADPAGLALPALPALPREGAANPGREAKDEKGAARPNGVALPAGSSAG